MAAMSTSSRRTWAARPIVGRSDSKPGTRLVAHALARKAAVRGAACATPRVRGSRRTARADCIGLAMPSKLTRDAALRVDRVLTRELGPAVTGHLGESQELAALAGAEGLAVSAEDQCDPSG